jgi:NAD-dependent dihydropyrimidine dehydrogenase PreA subunit
MNQTQAEIRQFKKDFYTTNSGKCHYCGVSEEKCRKFFSKGGDGFKSSRNGRRGKKLEVDKVDPLKPYKNSNCVLACYVCNNAKSNFSLEFFKPQIKGIKKSWSLVNDNGRFKK